MERSRSTGANAFLTSTKSPEIFTSFRHNITVQFNDYSPFKLSSNAYIQIAFCSLLPHLKSFFLVLM